MMIADFRLPIELLVHPGQVFSRKSAAIWMIDD